MQKKIVQKNVEKRAEKPIETTFDLIGLFDPEISHRKSSKFLTQFFQVLRIEFNDEIQALKGFLYQSLTMLKTCGRITDIFYHLLKDRVVKLFFKTGSFKGRKEEDFFGKKKTLFHLIYSKVIYPTEGKIEKNPCTRSIRLRITEKR
ncbi:MAG: 16S rRNA (cytosine(1402)-N(4))-methyltransferase [Flavobacteriales bacterium AspAUS03]